MLGSLSILSILSLVLGRIYQPWFSQWYYFYPTLWPGGNDTKIDIPNLHLPVIMDNPIETLVQSAWSRHSTEIGINEEQAVPSPPTFRQNIKRRSAIKWTLVVLTS